MPSGIVTPVLGRRMVGIRPYFFRIGQFCAGTRSKPLQPRRAASRHTSSNGILESKTPRVTHCLRRPLRETGAGVCAEAPETAVVAAARPVTKSLRRIGGLYRSGAQHVDVLLLMLRWKHHEHQNDCYAR